MGPGVRRDDEENSFINIKFFVPYPRPQNLAYPARVLSDEGRFMRRSEVGQSESWPEGQPEGRCGAWGRASQAPTGRPWVSVRPVTGSATVSWLDGDRRAAQKRRAQGPLRGSAKSPEERTRVLRRRGGTLRGVAVCLCFPAIRKISRGRYQGAPFGVPSPLIFEGRKR